MIFNNDLIFIHIGKTGGMSCSYYLIHNLQPPVYNCHHEVFAEMRKLKIEGLVPRADIHRHCTLTEALDYIWQFNGKQLKDFAKVVAVVRHPYTLEYSFYNHLQKPHVRERRKNEPHLLELADGDFKTFVEKAGYHHEGYTQDDFVRLDSEIPSCVELVRFEQLTTAFPKAVSGFFRRGSNYPFPHHNRTEYQTNISEELTEEVKELIYQKHKYMFDSGLYSTSIQQPTIFSTSSKRRTVAKQSRFPLVSIVILSYNGETFLRDCLQAVRCLDYPSIEIIVVDNASTDRSVSLVRQEFPEVQLIESSKNLGFAGGNNLGLNKAQGEIVVLLNQDTVVAENWLKELVTPVLDDPQIGIAGCKIYNADGQTLQHAGAYLLPNALSGHVGRDEPDQGQYDHLRDVEYVTGAALALTRQVIDCCGLLDPGYHPAYYEEADLCFTARRHGFRVVYVPTAAVVHHETVSSGGISPTYLYRYHKNRLRFVLKNYGWSAFWQEFAKFELEWLRNHKPPGNNLPLLKAYLRNLVALPAMLNARRRQKVGKQSALSLGLKGGQVSNRSFGQSPPAPQRGVKNIKIPPFGGLGGPPETSEHPTCPPLNSLGERAGVRATESTPLQHQAHSRNLSAPESGGVRATRKILILGGCPLPFENQRKTYSVGLRTWQLTEPLVQDGHEVCLIASRLLYDYPPGTKPVEKTVQGNFTYYSVDNAVFEGSDFVQTIHDQFQPDCLVAANSFPSYIAAGLRTEAPLWADLNGHLMTEAQSAAHAFDDDHYLDHFLAYEKQVVRRADIFSTSGQPQRFATLGELGLLKRLNKKTAGYTFVHTVPNAVEPVAYQPTKPVIRGLKAADADFVVLWSGGFNTWTDIDTLFAGLEMAMTHNPAIKFVSTGGAIKGHDEVTYPRFESLVQSSPHKSRYFLCGWVPREDVPNYFLEADVGVNIDKNTLEGVLGTRTRIYDWTKAALPTLTTNICELTQIMTRENICYTVPLGDPNALCERLLHLAGHREELKACGERARDYFFSQMTFAQTTLPLRQWVRQPQHAPDWCPIASPLQTSASEASTELPAQELLERLEEQERLTHRLYEQVTTLNQALDDIRATRWWRLATAYWGLRDWSQENLKPISRRDAK